MRSPLLFILSALVLLVSANVEKRFFFGPDNSNNPLLKEWRKTLISSGIEVLTPQQPTLRKKLHAAWPHSPSLGEPNHAWILLDNLETWRGYEIRISFSAMQPSRQNMSTHHINQTWYEKDLKDDVSKYLKLRKDYEISEPVPDPAPGAEQILFFFAVDPNFFTIDKKLMKEGILVEFDIVLDPYTLFNLIPRSSVPIAIYLAALTAIALPLSGLVWRSLHYVAGLEAEAKPRPGAQNKDD